jgi:hypothetical protein
MARSNGAAGGRLGGGFSAVNASRKDARPSMPVTLRGGIRGFETRVDPGRPVVANAGWTFATNNIMGNHWLRPSGWPRAERRRGMATFVA